MGKGGVDKAKKRKKGCTKKGGSKGIKTLFFLFLHIMLDKKCWPGPSAHV